MLTGIIIVVVIVFVVIFLIVSVFTGKKAQKKEQETRRKVVRDEIKSFIAKNENKRNLRIEFDSVIARKGADYKYRDVFDVIVNLIEPKTNEIIEERSYEVEGITTKIDKKNYKTSWQVNKLTDLDDTKRRIAIATKAIKLTKEEKKTQKKEEKINEIIEKKRLREELKEIKKIKKNDISVSGTDELEKKKKLDEIIKSTAVKFVPKRER